MKKIKLLLSLFILTQLPQLGFSQACLQGTPNPAVWGTIDDFSLGFTNDANPTDVDTSVVVQGSDTTIYVQYLLPKKQAITSPITGTATVTSIQILGVSGLPIGLSWTTDAAAFANNNTYDPQNYRYGVVSLCGETFAAPGVYTIVVNIQGCGSLSGLSACDAQTTDLYIEVLPGTGTGPIEMTPPVACNSATVSFDTDLASPDPILYPVQQAWLFHDGTTATGLPASKTYSAPGDYPVKLTTTIYEYYVSQATISATGGWTGDIEELTTLQNPELYLLINGGSGSVTTSTASSGTNKTFNGLNVPITSFSVSINAWDEDNGPPFGSQDDNLGTATTSFTALSPGLVLGYNANNFSGTITIQQQVNTVLENWDTVRIQATSAANNLLASNGFAICTGDSTILDAGAGFDYYQWYDDNGVILNANSQTLTVNSIGNFVVEVLETGNICPGFSDTATITIESVTTPLIEAMNGEVYTANPNSYDVQWYSDNIQILNETNDTLSANAISAGGAFTVSFTNNLACEELSSPFSLCIPGTSMSNGSLISFSGDEIDFTAEDFILNSGNIIAWAISTDAQGPITNMAELQVAIDSGWVFPGDGDSTLNLACSDVSLENGDYLMTPFTAEALVVDPIYYDMNEAASCRPSMEVCISLSGSNYQVSPLELILPNGDTIDVIGELAGGLIPPGTPIDPTLWSVATSQFGDPVCIDLIDILQYTEDPNGTWTFILPNTGSGALNFNIADFDMVVLADSCNNLTSDQITSITGISGTVNAGNTGVFSITIPPLPSNFPSVAVDCETFGTATAFTAYCTDTNVVILTPDTITFAIGTVIVDSNGDTTVLDGSNTVSVNPLDSFYIVENGVATVYINELGTTIEIQVDGVMIYIIETTEITSYTPPTIVLECEAGFSSSNGVVVNLNGDQVTLTASDFNLLSGNSVAWAVTSEADGPVITIAELQAAIAANMVFPGDNDTIINLACSDLNLANGNYYATPFTAQSVTIDTSVAWDPFSVACTPQINICIGLSGTDWEINPLLMVLPTGDTLDVIATLAAGIVPPGTPVNSGLWGLATSQLGDPACLELVSMLGFNDNPNGTWEMILPNTGTGTLDIALSGMNVTVLTDSCSQISNDIVYNIPDVNASILAGTTESIEFIIDLPQPPPANFPNIVGNCDVIGDGVLFTVYCTDTSTSTRVRELTALGELSLYPNPNNGEFSIGMNVRTSGEYQINMIDLLGRVVQSWNYELSLGQQQLNVVSPNLNAGIYHLQISNESNQQSIKMIIK